VAGLAMSDTPGDGAAERFDKGISVKQREWRPTDRMVANHVDWWADHVQRRLLGNVRRAKGYNTGPPKPAWDRTKFLRNITVNAPDYGEAAALADKFEAAITAAHGNPTRFRQELERRLSL
jgi:hypothetical protein